MLILRDLMFKGARHYADFINAGEQISTNILAVRLVRLEDEGIVTKRADPKHRKRYIYALTEKGMGLLPAMLAIIDWAEVWDDRTEVPVTFVKELRRSRSALVQRLELEVRMGQKSL